MLRAYQQKAVDQIRWHFARGTKKVLLHLSTGGGKTVIFCHMLAQAINKNKKAIMVVRGRQLVDQASKRLFRENVQHGVLMSGHWNRNMLAPLQICSVDTVIARNLTPPADLIVIDEAHMATSEGYKEFLAKYPNAFVVAVTATPYTKDPLRHVADEIVYPISTEELMEQGYLLRPRYYSPSRPDLRGVNIVNGDYVNSQLQERMNAITGDIVHHWRELGQKRPTVLFAVNIAHSKAMVEEFIKHGINAEHIEAESSFAEREAAIERLRTGRISVLCNVGILCTGVDMPFLSCLILARPTKSYNLYIQQCGRGTRPDPDTNKKDFLILDHAGNIRQHGFITNEVEVFLDGNKRSKEDKGASTKTCAKCYLVFAGGDCPECGPIAKADRGVELEEGDLEEIKTFSLADQVAQDVRRWKELRKARGYKRGFVYMKVKEKYGQEVADELYPNSNRDKDFAPWLK